MQGKKINHEEAREELYQQMFHLTIDGEMPINIGNMPTTNQVISYSDKQFADFKKGLEERASQQERGLNFYEIKRLNYIQEKREEQKRKENRRPGGRHLDCPSSLIQSHRKYSGIRGV